MRPAPRRIAVVGAGISGLAVAALLAQRGLEVEIHEKGPKRPEGAGLVLQMTGLAVLQALGLRDQALNVGSRLIRFQGTTASGKTVFDLSHRAPGHVSLGIHRHALFDLLHGRVIALGIPVVTGFHAKEVSLQAGSAFLQDSEGRVSGPFNAVIDASGAHSALRDRHAHVRSRRTFSHGALWGVCEMPPQWPRDMLCQRFRRAHTSIGVIPIGKRPGGGSRQHVGLHWSIRNVDHPAWRSAPIEAWKAEVVRLWPATQSLVDQIDSHDDLTWAVYGDVALERFHRDRIVFIGDACHSISPRLGQGANLGLVDALVLARCLVEANDLASAFGRYDRARRAHVRFYHAASRYLTFLFQSDSVVAPALRDLAFRPISRLPFMERQMLESLGGGKTGLFSRLDLQTLT